jgi:hypothetical protein
MKNILMCIEFDVQGENVGCSTRIPFVFPEMNAISRLHL